MNLKSGEVQGGGRALRDRLLRYPEIGALAAFLVVFVGLAIAGPGFLSVKSFAGVLAVVAELGIVTVGVALLMITGEFDLSVGSVLAVSSMSFALLLRADVPVMLAFSVGLACAAAIGLVNGLIVVSTGIPSFITTLGAMMFWRGILLAVTGGMPIAYFGERTFFFELLNSRFWGDFRTSVVWFILVVVFAHMYLQHTTHGNWMYATGGSRQSARGVGIPVNRVKVINFVICAVLAGLAGMIQFGRFMSVDAMRGRGLELQAIAAAVTGGILLTGGFGRVLGALLGILIIGMVRTGLVLAGAPAYWYDAFVGAIVVVAVIINVRIKGAQG